MHEVAKLISWGSGTTRGIGHIDARAPEFARRFLVTNKQIGDVRALDNAYTQCGFGKPFPLRTGRWRNAKAAPNDPTATVSDWC
jgi:hypothetical protein